MHSLHVPTPTPTHYYGTGMHFPISAQLWKIPPGVWLCEAQDEGLGVLMHCCLKCSGHGMIPSINHGGQLLSVWMHTMLPLWRMGGRGEYIVRSVVHIHTCGGWAGEVRRRKTSSLPSALASRFSLHAQSTPLVHVSFCTAPGTIVFQQCMLTELMCMIAPPSLVSTRPPSNTQPKHN